MICFQILAGKWGTAGLWCFAFWSMHIKAFLCLEWFVTFVTFMVQFMMSHHCSTRFCSVVTYITEEYCAVKFCGGCFYSMIIVPFLMNSIIVWCQVIIVWKYVFTLVTRKCFCKRRYFYFICDFLLCFYMLSSLVCF